MARYNCLIVDDEVTAGRSAVARMVRGLLVQRWPEIKRDLDVALVRSYDDGVAWLYQLSKHHECKLFLVTDYDLGPEPGSELIKVAQYKVLRERCFAVLTSGLPHEALIADPVARGVIAADRFLSKPVKSDDFKKMLPKLAEFWGLPAPHTST